MGGGKPCRKSRQQPRYEFQRPHEETRCADGRDQEQDHDPRDLIRLTSCHANITTLITRSGAACAVGAQMPAAVAFHCRRRPGPQRQDHGYFREEQVRPCQTEDEVSSAGLSRDWPPHRDLLSLHGDFRWVKAFSGPQRRIGARQRCCKENAERILLQSVAAATMSAHLACGRAWLQCLVGDRDRAGEAQKAMKPLARHSRRIVGAGHHVLRPAGKPPYKEGGKEFERASPTGMLLIVHIT